MPVIPRGLEGIAAQLFGRALDDVARHQGDPLLRSVLAWVARLQAQMQLRWRPILASGIRCAIARQADGRLATCPSPAIGACTFCRAPVCLGHSFVDGDATVLCFGCVGRAAKALGVDSARAEIPPHHHHGAAFAEGVRERRAKRKAALKTLGLRDPASIEEIKEAFRDLMKKHHPDRAPEGKKEEAAERVKAITEAYHWLDAHPGGQEVAA